MDMFFDHTLLSIFFNDHVFFSNTTSKTIYGVLWPNVFCSERRVGDLSQEARPKICFWGIIWWFLRSNQIYSKYVPKYCHIWGHIWGVPVKYLDYQHYVEKVQYAYFTVWPQILPYLNRIWGRTASDKMFREKFMINMQIRPTRPYG